MIKSIVDFFSKVKERLSTPNDFSNNWYEWVTNQGSHSGIIGTFIFLILAPFINSMFYLWILGAAGYWFVWEFLVQKNSSLDSIVDAGNVSVGIAIPAIAFNYIPNMFFLEAYSVLVVTYIVWMVFLTIGVIRRI